MTELFLPALTLGNVILSSAIIIVSFSLVLYLAATNFRNSAARSFAALLAFITLIYIGDVFLQRVETFDDAVLWLKFKWIGLAFIPASYLHFSDALLRSTNAYAPWRRGAVTLAYCASGAFLILVAFGDLVVRDGFHFPTATQFSAGPLFPLFAVFFFALTGWGVYNIQRARQRCLTATTRRRMTYLAAAFIAPALGVFPYLIIASFPAEFSPALLLLLTLFAKIGIAAMITVMAYTVAYQGALSPDRVVKHNLIHYLLRGPLVATAVVGLMFFAPTVERWVGLSRDTMLYVIVIGAVVSLELLINIAKPWIDRLVFWGDREELDRIEEIDKRLLTTSDLRQLLENVLSAVCDLLRVQTGFVAAIAGEEWQFETIVGSRETVRRLMPRLNMAELLHDDATNANDLFARDGFWLWRLRAKSAEGVIGLMGVAARAPVPDLSAREEQLIAALVRQAELALEDRQLQQGLFSVLEDISSEIALLQRARGTRLYAGALTEEQAETGMAQSPEFHRAVKDALDHYWGGPKLTESPLLNLRIVQNALAEHENNPTRALRAQIVRAIESLKPDGQRSLTAPEWLLYNILELKVLQGKKIREIAYHLAMSESDVYRKQRIAIQELAKTIATMEEQGKEDEPRANTAADREEPR